MLLIKAAMLPPALIAGWLIVEFVKNFSLSETVGHLWLVPVAMVVATVAGPAVPFVWALFVLFCSAIFDRAGRLRDRDGGSSTPVGEDSGGSSRQENTEPEPRS